MKHLIYFSLICLTLGIYSCDGDEEPVDPPVIVEECDAARTYTDDIQAIIETNCAIAACHDAASAAADIVLADYTTVAAEAEMSRFLSAIRHESGFTAMPIGAAQLSEELITEIACWVEQGRPE